MKTAKTTKTPKTKASTATPTPVIPVRKKAPVKAVKAASPEAPIPSMIAARKEITTDLIAARAYTIWEQQGRPHGNEMQNWLLAESQLKHEIQSFTA